MKRMGWLATILLYMSGCKSHTYDENMAQISCYVYGAQGQMLYLMTIPSAGEKRKTLDSAIVNNVKDSIVFMVPLSGESRYMLEIKQTLNKFYFIPDVAFERVRANNMSGHYTTEGSAASASLVAFKNKQAQLQKQMQQLYAQGQRINSKERQNDSSTQIKKLMADRVAALHEYARSYADTTANAGVFLNAYDVIDFGEDYKEALVLVKNAAKRFPNSKGVAQLRANLLATADIYEHEFNIGDTLPSIQLPDLAGRLFSTASLKGKYYLIDFWSTWCSNCAAFEKGKLAVKKMMGDKVEVVSVAMDDNAYDWQHIVRSRRLNWIQLIDEKMWKGSAVRTLKFDSIPFNFFVSPQGKILAKAIPADSMISVIKKVTAP